MKKIKMWKNMYCTVQVSECREYRRGSNQRNSTKRFRQESFSDYSLYMVGSTISGFGSDVSDVDMCLVDTSKTGQVYFGNDLRLHSAKILKDFELLLRRNGWFHRRTLKFDFFKIGFDFVLQQFMASSI